MIYTSYFAKIRSLPQSIVPISIALKSPTYFQGLQYKVLAPSSSILYDWKFNGSSKEVYTRRFFDEILNNLSCEQVVSELKEMSGGKDIALVCYEKSSDFCHRHLVAEWLKSNGIECQEWEGI